MTTTAEKPNVVRISDAGPSRKKIFIEIPAETVSAKVGDSMAALATQAALPGFRPGHVPKGLVEKKFGTAVRGETKEQLVAQAYSKAVEDHKLKVVGQPTSDKLKDLEIVPGKPFSFELEVEVMPEFKLPALEGIAVLRPMLSVTDEMIEKEVTNLKINEGELESREKADDGDYCTGHAIMTGKDGTEFYNINGAVIQIPTPDKKGKGMILGVWVEDFSKQVGRPKAGDAVTVRVKGPENHEVEAIRNADLTVTFKVDRVDRIIPAKIESVVQKLGFDGEASMRDAIRSRMNQRVQTQQQVAMRQQLARYLVENTGMDLPQRLSSQQAARVLEQRRMELMYRGVKATDIEQHMAELRAASATMATRDLKLSFILAKAGEELNVKVDEGDINNRIVQMAFERGVRPEKLRQEVIKSNQVGAIYTQVRDHRAMDTILAKAKVSDVPAEEFNKKMQEWDKADAKA